MWDTSLARNGSRPRRRSAAAPGSEHLQIGEGELNWRGICAALAESGFRGVASVELPRHSHAAPQVAAEAIARLRALMIPHLIPTG
jgi:sugar phosphate isomerase/epimerase